MDKLDCVQQWHDRLVRLISLAASQSLGLFIRLVSDWLGLRNRFSLHPEEVFLVHDISSVFDVCYHDATVFHQDAESHLDWEFEPKDSGVSDPEPATRFWDLSFDDSNLIGEPPPEYGGPLNKELAPEDDELVGALFTSSFHPWLSIETLKFLTIGSVVHLAALSLFIVAPSSLLPGLRGISEKPILVRLKEARDISTPDAPSPASVDSPASPGALAKRNPKPLEKRTWKQTAKELPSEVELKEVIGKTETESRLAHAKLDVEPVVSHENMPVEQSLDGSPNDSKSLQDSIASMPSVASPDKKGALKAGDEAQTYKDRIFSAIHEAAYYPRAALRNMAYGKTVVCFTINKDGSLARVAIVAHADSEILDKAALKIVENASSHFPPVPDSLMKEQVSYVVPIVFKKGL